MENIWDSVKACIDETERRIIDETECRMKGGLTAVDLPVVTLRNQMAIMRALLDLRENFRRKRKAE